jgi:two-component system NarL family response regulator
MSLSQPAPKIRILLVDDHFAVRAGLAVSLSLEADLAVVAEASNGADAITAYREHRPDVVIMDWRLPDMTGVQVTAALRGETPPPRVLMLSAYEGEEDVYSAVHAGATGYLSKAARLTEVLEAIHAVHRGQSYFPAAMNAKLIARLQRPELSSRERDVLSHIAKGQSNKQIAVDLGISDETVKQHVAAVMAKLQADNRAHAASLAIQRGILHLE